MNIQPPQMSSATPISANPVVYGTAPAAGAAPAAPAAATTTSSAEAPKKGLKPPGPLTENETQALHALLRELLKPRNEGDKYEFTMAEISYIKNKMLRLFHYEDACVEMKLPCAFVGNLNGQLVDLLRSLSVFRTAESPGHLNTRFVYLGNYVGKGGFSLECLMLLFTMKLLWPKAFVLLRGSNETTKSGCSNGFYDELTSRYPQETADKIFVGFNHVFNFMPLCAIVADSILCVHSGIGTEMTSRENLKKIPKPIIDPSHYEITASLLWSDPLIGESTMDILSRDEGEQGCHFGEAILTHICKQLKVRLVVRGHQTPPNGFRFFNKSMMVTVNAACSQSEEKTVMSAVLYIDAEGKAGFKSWCPVIPGRDREDKATIRDDFRRTYELNDLDTVHDMDPKLKEQLDKAKKFARKEEEKNKKNKKKGSKKAKTTK